MTRQGLVIALVLLPAFANAFEVDGKFLGRWTVGGFAEGYAVVATDNDSRRQRPAGLLGFSLTGDLQEHARLFLDMRTTFGGTPENADGIGFMNLRDTYQNISPFVEAEEAYVDFYLPSL